MLVQQPIVSHFPTFQFARFSVKSYGTPAVPFSVVLGPVQSVLKKNNLGYLY